jgi:hypothetical protein
VKIGYTPTSPIVTKGDLYLVYDSADAKTPSNPWKYVRMTKELYNKCKEHYNCKVGNQLYQVRADSNGKPTKAFNKVTKVTNYKGDELKPGSLAGPGDSKLNSPFFKLYKMNSKVKLNNKSITLKDVCTDCDRCEVSVYAGPRDKQPSEYNGFKRSSSPTYTLKRA